MSQGRRWRWGCLGAIAGATAIVVALVVAVLVTRDRTPGPDPWVEQAGALAELLDHPNLYAAVYEPDFDPDALLTRLKGLHPQAYDAAVAAHEPFGMGPDDGIHAIFERHLKLSIAVDLDGATLLGAHPHPHGVTHSAGGLTECRLLLIARDAWTALEVWHGGFRAATELAQVRRGPVLPRADHDRIDYALYRAVLEATLRYESDDRDRLALVLGWFDPLFTLHRFACCSAVDRAAAAASRLDGIAAHLATEIGALEAPPRALVAHTIRRLDDAVAYLRTYADAWDGLDPDARDALRASGERALAALGAAKGTLSEQVLPAATGELGIGPERYARALRLQYTIEEPLAALYEEAWKAFMQAQMAENDRRLTWDDAPWEFAAGLTAEDRIQALRERTLEWFPARFEGDITPTVQSFPRLWGSTFAGAYYVEGPLLAPANRPLVIVGPQTSSEDDWGAAYQEATLRRVLAHEAYPGHHLQAVACRDACLLRKAIGNATAAEGWATYAEELDHAAVSTDLAHEMVQLESVSLNAWYAVLDIALHTRIATPEQILGWMKSVGMAETQADLGAFAEHPGHTLTYLFGHREILRFRDREQARLGADFDLREFHERLIRAGYVPPHLLDDE